MQTFNGRDNLRIGGGISESHINPVVLAIVLICIVLMFLLPRKYVVVPFLLTLFCTPFGQEIYIAGAHVLVGRILILFGWMRILKGKIAGHSRADSKMTVVDKTFLCWAIFQSVVSFLEFMQVQAIVTECGFLIDSIGAYFLLRFFIRDEKDILRAVKTLASIASFLGVTMLVEHFAGRNLFGMIGGISIPEIRDGAIRAQATFEGPIPAGTFGAVIFCLFIWLWMSKKSRTFAVIGLVGSALMVLTSASSTPAMTVPAAVLAIAMWPARRYMRQLRWGIVIALISLNMVMKAPVWMIINHVSVVSGNSSYHRAMLVDQFVRHFWDWCLIGVRSTRDWGWDMWDQANQFVWEGESGGLATFICFILLISGSFSRLGKARKLAHDRNTQWFFWLLGASLFAFIVAFFGISLVDQLATTWYLLLALIGAATTSSGLKTNKLRPQAQWSYPAVESMAEGSNKRELVDRRNMGNPRLASIALRQHGNIFRNRWN